MKNLFAAFAALLLLASCATTRTTQKQEETKHTTERIDSTAQTDRTAAKVSEASHEEEQSIEIEFETPVKKDSAIVDTVKWWGHVDYAHLPPGTIKKVKYTSRQKSTSKDSTGAQERWLVKNQKDMELWETKGGLITTKKGPSLLEKIGAYIVVALLLGGLVWLFLSGRVRV